MPFEDRPLHQTVSQHIRATGAEEVADGKRADMVVYVYASRQEKGRAETFAVEIETVVKAGKKVIVADIDPRGDVQGSDPDFVDALNRRGLFSQLNGYAAWNTAGNTMGTALSQGVVFSLAEEKLLKIHQLTQPVLAAQHWFTLHRVMDDFYFHTLVRAETNAYLNQRKQSSLIMSVEKTQRGEIFSRKIMQEYFETFTQTYFKHSTSPFGLTCRASSFQFSLPWNRMFEASIDFTVRCDSL